MVIWSALASGVILLILKAVFGLRVSQEDEYVGLDTSLHGESAYNS